MSKKIILGIIIVIAVIGGLAGVKIWQIVTMVNFGAHFVPPPETVSSATAKTEQWPQSLTAVGSVNAAEGIIVSPEIAGTVSEIDFESGATVNKGDLLLRMDTSSEDAQLRAAEAQVQLAKLTADRSQQLSQSKTISQTELDTANATLEQYRANADAIRAVINKKTIRAPFSGRLGIRLVNLGQQLQERQGLVSLQSLSPMYVDFTLPQQDLSKVSTGLVVQVKSDAYPDMQFTGTLAAINPDLNSTTRSVQLRAKFDNTNELLRAGMFAQVEVLLPADDSVLVIPATALLSAPYGDSVFLILPPPPATNGVPASTNEVVQQTIVQTGRSRGDFVSVQTGIKAGDRVVSAGQFKLRSGMPVVENDEMAPAVSQTPMVPNK